MLDNRLHLTRRIANDPPIAARIGQLHGKQAQLLLVDLLQQRREGFHTGQRHVAVEDQHLVGVHLGHRLGHRMAGTELLGLQHEMDILGRQALAYLLGAVANHHMDLARCQSARRIDDMPQHGLARHLMQYLGQCRAHAGTLSGGENDDIQRHQGYS